jgi:fumarate hydratase class I
MFMKNGGSLITLAKGNRSKQVTEGAPYPAAQHAHAPLHTLIVNTLCVAGAACKKYGGFYLGSIGGPAARLAQDCIKKVEVLEYPELGMEAVWRIEVEDFPAFVIVDDKGEDFFKNLSH